MFFRGSIDRNKRGGVRAEKIQRRFQRRLPPPSFDFAVRSRCDNPPARLTSRPVRSTHVFAAKNRATIAKATRLISPLAAGLRAGGEIPAIIAARFQESVSLGPSASASAFFCRAGGNNFKFVEWRDNN